MYCIQAKSGEILSESNAIVRLSLQEKVRLSKKN